ncbi:MAG: CoA transferase, partial [Paracoccaceae bacterium]
FPASDGWFIIAIGNDGQLARFAEAAGRPELAADPRFATNPARVVNHDELIRLMREITRQRTEADWMKTLSAVSVPTGPVNDIPAAIDDPQAISRGSRVKQPHPAAGNGYVETLGNPAKLSRTPVTYRRPPPMVGQHTDEVLAELGFDAAEMREKGALG